MNFLDQLNRFPPYVVRLLACSNHGKRWRNTRDIARDSGLSHTRVAEISMMRVWDDLPARTICAFLKGCNVDVSDKFGRDLLTQKLRTNNRMCHLRNLTARQRAFVGRLMKLAKTQ